MVDTLVGVVVPFDDGGLVGESEEVSVVGTEDVSL